MSSDPVARAFDAHALDYAQTWDDDLVAQWMRAEVHATFARHVAARARVLDAGCGVGTDAAWLVARGHEVVAIDRSEAMVRATTARVPHAQVHHLRVEGCGALAPVDAALLDFGVVNLVDLAQAGAALHRVLRPGGILVVVTMPPHNPRGAAHELLRGRFGAARARLLGTRSLRVAGESVSVALLSPGALTRAWRPWFATTEVRSLGCVVAPPGAGARPRGIALDRMLGRLPGLRQMGDHAIVVMQRRST